MEMISEDLPGGPPHRGLGVDDDWRARGSRNAVLARPTRRNQALLDLMNGPRKRDNVRLIQLHGDLRDPNTRIQPKQCAVTLCGDYTADLHQTRIGKIPNLLGRKEGRRCRDVARILVDDLEMPHFRRLPELGVIWAADSEDPPGKLLKLRLDGITDNEIERVILECGEPLSRLFGHGGR